MDLKLDFEPIGTVRSCFPCKNGTPRQPTVSSKARGQLKISKGIYNNPEHALDGLQEFSHIWIIFLFHKNKPGKFLKAKVSPPRLNGGRIGVFATRSPYRLNPIGLSLVKLESVEGDTLYFSGHDLVDGTPVLDIKPYISEYDAPPDDTGSGRARSPAASCGGEDVQAAGDVPPPQPDHRITAPSGTLPTDGGQSYRSPGSPCQRRTTDSRPAAGVCDVEKDSLATRPGPDRRPAAGKARPGQAGAAVECVKSPHHEPVADSPDLSPGPDASCQPADGGAGGDTWLSRLRPERWTVDFTASAEWQLRRFSAAADAGPHRLRWLKDATELRSALVEVLTAEPRSVYRRAQGDHLLYHFALDACHVTCWFDSTRRVIEVLRLQSLADSPLGDLAAVSTKEAEFVSPGHVKEAETLPS